MDLERQPVLGGVPAREPGIGRLQLEPVQLEPRHPARRGRAPPRRPRSRARARARRGAPGRRRREARDRSRRGSRARGCQSRRRPSRKASQRELLRGEATRLTPAPGRPPRCRAGRRGRGRSRGRRPSPAAAGCRSSPSSTLMWTSRTKQSISSPRSSAVLKAMTVGSLVRRSSRMARRLETATAEVESEELAPRAHPARAAAGGARRRHGAGGRADPRPHGERARPAHPGGHRAPGRGRRQAAAAAPHARRGAALRLRRRAPPAARGDGRVHPHRDAAARRRGRRERAAARAPHRQPALGQQVERAGRGLPLRARLPAHGRDRRAPRPRHPGQRLGGDRRGRGAAAHRGLEPRDRRGDLPAGGARQDRGALRRGDRGRRRDRRRARAAGARARHLRRRARDRLPDRRRPARLRRGERQARQEHRRRLPRAQDDAAGDPGPGGRRARRARVLGAGHRQGRPARGRPRAGDGADGAARQPREHARDRARARPSGREQALRAPRPRARSARTCWRSSPTSWWRACV